MKSAWEFISSINDRIYTVDELVERAEEWEQEIRTNEREKHEDMCASIHRTLRERM